MDEELDLGAVFGGGEDMEAEPMAAEDEGEGEYPPDFEVAIVEAFPDLAEDPDRIAAMYRAIEACK